MNRLNIVLCGQEKIWDKHPHLNMALPAYKVYIGDYTKQIIIYVIMTGEDYYMLSGVYGLIHPSTLIKNYNSHGKLVCGTKLVEQQIKDNNLDEYDEIIYYGNKYFKQILDKLFKKPTTHFFPPESRTMPFRKTYIKKKQIEALLQ